MIDAPSNAQWQWNKKKKQFHFFCEIISFDNVIWVRNLEVTKLKPCLTLKILLKNIKDIYSVASVIDFAIEDTEIPQKRAYYQILREFSRAKAFSRRATTYLGYVLQIVTIIKQPKRNTTQSVWEFPMLMAMPIIDKLGYERK